MKKFWEVKQIDNGTKGEIYIFGEIVRYKWDEEDTTASSFQKDLKELGDVSEITVHVNSPGGSVFEGIAIGNMLKAHSATVTAYVDALAASIASVIVASCDKVIMPENSMLMIHNPMQGIWGNAKVLRKAADDLDKIAESSVITYLSKAGESLTESKIKQIMDEETWLSAKEAKELGLCDVIDDAVDMAACWDSKFSGQYQNIPVELIQNNSKPVITEERKQLATDSKKNLQVVQTILGGI